MRINSTIEDAEINLGESKSRMNRLDAGWGIVFIAIAFGHAYIDIAADKAIFIPILVAYGVIQVITSHIIYYNWQTKLFVAQQIKILFDHQMKRDIEQD
jgi:hypothetical protein